MRKRISIGLIGDYDKSVPAHQAIPLALQSAAKALQVELGFEWVPTEEIVAPTRVSSFSGLWCVPGSPYRSMAGALLAIRHARENGVPFLGTCGGFQHALSVELDGHPFFVATLFQPERASLAGKSAPLAVALVRACAT